MLHHRPSNLLLLLLSGGSLGVANGQVYGPLDCNANIDCTVSTPLSTLVNGAGGLDRVIVPCGQCAHVDYTAGETISLPLGLEVVGSLLFPPSSNVVLNTTAVIVQGNLDIEPPAEGNEVKVILHGSEEQYLYPHDECNGGYDPSCSAKASVGKKPIVVAGGKVNIRGMDAAIDCPSWTRLDRKVSDTNLKIDPSFAACVKPGDDLLVTSDNTNWQDEMKRQVTAVNSTTGEITLDSAITRALPALTGPGEPEYAVEVARLSRSVVFTAVEDDPEGEHIGGHFMVFVTPDVVQVISGVHFDNFGQGGNLGRYPVHFHLCDNSNGSIVSKNVITNSNQRCVLIHGTNGVTVEDNVAWNTRGHCYATETGTEVNNIFKNNLGSHTMKLWFHNTQSDSLNFWTGKHTAATFWVRNMNNEWIGNVAAGSESLGWWIEMRELNGDQKTLEPISSFRDNVAHSNKVVGFGTYKQGWKPTNGGVLDNLHIYKNPDIGFKYHITGNIRVTNSLFADNGHHILSGVWNSPVTFENSVFDSMSQDRQLRQEITCPVATYKTAIKHAYNNDIASPLTFINATFANLKCGKNMFQFHNDNRGGGRSMGAPTRASGITLINVDENRKPHFNCDFGARDTFLEDVDGVLGPSSSTGSPGFIVRNVAWMLAFIPPESCSNIPYSGSDCSVYCEGTCLRQVSIQPSFGGQASTTLDLRLFDGVTEKVYQSQGFADFRIVLPQGSYHGSFFDVTGTEVIASSVEVTPYQEPLCNDFVTHNDFVFTTNEPTPAPTYAPTISPAPTAPADSVVRIESIVNNRYLWVKPDGGLKVSSDMTPLANTGIVLMEVECLSEGYHFDKGLTSPCYLIQWEHGPRLGAKSDQVWTKGVYTTSNSVVNDNYWFLDPIACEVTGLEEISCTLLINAFNGRVMYDHDTFMDMGASPSIAQGGDLDSLVYSKKLYRWNLIRSDCSVYCEGTCLRQVSIQPSFDGQSSTTLDLHLFDGVTEKVYQSQGFADFRIVLPQGSYHGSFFDVTGTEVIASSVEVTPYQEPLCNDFVTANDFIFTTNEPTPAPSHGPTISPAPTFPADSVVRVKSIVNNRYLWVRPDGGLKASSDMTPLANTAIVLIKKECLSEGYHFDKGLTSPCYLIQWEHGRRLGAKSGQVWLKGVYATSNEVVNDNYWFLDPIGCEVTGLEGNSCTLLINAFNGRAMYDHDTFMDMGASPEVAQGGDLDSLVYSKKLYRWTLIDANA